MFLNIVRWYFYKKLRAELSARKRNKQVHNLLTAKTIGILYDATLAENNVLVTAFAEKLKSAGKVLTLLGYINDKKTTSTSDITVFNNKSLTIFKVPSGKEVEDFLAKPFDILINAHTDESLPLIYVAAMSKASFKIGPYIEEAKDSFDLLIQLVAKQDLHHYLDQVKHHLQNLQPNGK